MVIIKTSIFFLVIILATSCSVPMTISPNSNLEQTKWTDTSIVPQVLGSWILDLETMKNNAPLEIHQNIDMLSMMGGDLFKIDVHENGTIRETGFGEIKSIGKWVENGKGISVSFEPNEMQKEMLNRFENSSPETVVDIQYQLKREIQLIGAHLMFEYSMGPKKLTFYLKKS